MARTFYTYQDIPKPLRTRRSNEVLRALQGNLSNPDLSEEQRAKVIAQQQRIRGWVNGTLSGAKNL